MRIGIFLYKHLPNKNLPFLSQLDTELVIVGSDLRTSSLHTHSLSNMAHCVHHLWLERLSGAGAGMAGLCWSHFLEWVWENICNCLSSMWPEEHAILPSRSNMHFRSRNKYPDIAKGSFSNTIFFLIYIFLFLSLLGLHFYFTASFLVSNFSL